MSACAAPDGDLRPCSHSCSVLLEMLLRGRGWCLRHSAAAPSSARVVAASPLIAIGASVCIVTWRSLQYLESSHFPSDFVPLLELQPMQQSAIFASLTSAMLLTMCSHDAQAVRGLGATSKVRPQYTQWRSRAITTDARSRGIFQRAAV